MCEPLRAKGVEVVYGYSESVTFEGDYRFEKTFWDAMVEQIYIAANGDAILAPKVGDFEIVLGIATPLIILSSPLNFHYHILCFSATLR